MNNQTPPMYPLHSLPPVARDAAQEIMDLAQVPDIVAGMSILTALSVSISPLADWVHPLSRQVRPSVLNLAISAASGDRKTSADTLALRPFYDHDKTSDDEHKAACATFATSKMRWGAVKKAILARISKLESDGQQTAELDARLDAHEEKEPMKPVSPRVIYQKLTYVSALEALAGDGRPIALVTDEGQTLLSSTVMQHYGFLNQAWDGKELVTYDRAEGESIIVRNPRMTISFMIQPDVLQDFFAKRGKIVHGSGFCARYLFANAPSLQGLREPRVSAPPKDLLPFYARIGEFLKAYQERAARGAISRNVLEFDEPAVVRWIQLAGQVEMELRPWGFLNDISDFGNKFMDMVGRIACLIWYLDNFKYAPGEGEECDWVIGKIGPEALNSAWNIAYQHLLQYKLMFSPQSLRTRADFDADRLYSYLHRAYFAHHLFEAEKVVVRRRSGLTGSRFDDAFDVLLRNYAVGITQVRKGRSDKTTEFIVLNQEYFRSRTPI